MSNLTQQQIGAQKAAGDKVLAKQAEFQGELSRIQGNVDGIRSAYMGQGANAFYNLVNSWMEDARALINEFEGYAQRLKTVDTTTATSQDDQSATFQGAATSFTTRL